MTFDMTRNSMTVHNSEAEPWIVTTVDTGEATGTGGRLRRIADYVKDEEAFCVTYGDGVADIDIEGLIAFHKSHGKQMTLTAVQPIARFGSLGIDGSSVYSFLEKPSDEGGWINAGFWVMSPKALSAVTSDDQMFEREPIDDLVKRGEVQAYFHRGFWQPMDALRDRQLLEGLWDKGAAPWKKW